jgi:RAQPRD family integrative conjugative element protein
MKRHTKVIAVSVICLSGLFSTQVQADDAQMKDTMVKIINQLEMIKPLIDLAAQQQNQDKRVTFHFEDWVDVNGVKHNGLRGDIELIETGVVTGVNRQAIEPRQYAPINGDYLSQ